MKERDLFDPAEAGAEAETETGAEAGFDAWADRALAHINDEYDELLLRATERRNQAVVRNIAGLKREAEESVRECRARNISAPEKEAAIRAIIEAYQARRDALKGELI